MVVEWNLMFCLVVLDMFILVEGYGKVELINIFFLVSRFVMDINSYV